MRQTEWETYGTPDRAGSFLRILRLGDSRENTGDAGAVPTDQEGDHLEAPIGSGESIAFEVILETTGDGTTNTGIVISVPEGADGSFQVSGARSGSGFFSRGYGADSFNTSVGVFASGLPNGTNTIHASGVVLNGGAPGLISIQLGDAEALGASLVFVQQPGRTPVNGTIQPAVTIAVLDADGVVNVSDDTTQITIAKGGGAGTLGGTLTQTVINGIATFANLTLDTVDDDYTLVASATDLTSATSAVFEVVGTASTIFARMIITTTPQSVANNTDEVIEFDDADVDEGGFIVSTTTMTIPAGLAGAYLISAGFGWDAAAADSNFQTRVFKNGASIFDGTMFVAAGFAAVTNATFSDQLAVGDDLTVIAHHDSGSPQNVLGGAISITKL